MRLRLLIEEGVEGEGGVGVGRRQPRVHAELSGLRGRWHHVQRRRPEVVVVRGQVRAGVRQRSRGDRTGGTVGEDRFNMFSGVFPQS